MSTVQKQIQRTFAQTQTLKLPEKFVERKELDVCAENWKHEDLPHLQMQVSDLQLEAMRSGIVVPEFLALAIGNVFVARRRMCNGILL